MRYLFTLALFITLGVNAQIVCFDRILSQPVYVHDAGPSGISQLSNELQKNGAELVTTIQNWQRLNVLTANGSDYSGVVYVITPSIHRMYSNDIVNHYKGLINKGAHLVVIAEHENYYFNADNLNRLCQPYGITINNNAVKKGDSVESGWVVGKSDKYSLNNLCFYLPASLQCDSNVEHVATVDTNVICASVKAGKGRITVLGDYEMLWNMTPTQGINYGDNKAFLTNLLTPEDNPVQNYTPTSQFVQWLKASTDSLGPYKFWLAEDVTNPAKLGKNDVVFFIYPTTYLTWPDSVFKQIGKAVIVGGEYSDYFKLLQDAGGINILNSLGYKREEMPINSIAKHYGVTFSQSVVNGGGGENEANLKITTPCCGSEDGFKSYNNNMVESAGYLTIKTTGFTTPYTATGNELYYYGYLGFDETLGPDKIVPVPPGTTKLTNVLVCVYNKNVFAISAPVLWDYLTSIDKKDNTMVAAFKKWLKMK
ncbi:MAG: hypothetical protein M0D57_01915 [Sphingobacteriales bacterium JAD_PAG50586_3]|nr:MAG: hypothetical protein M0D57_01915 [Sphingobacteriales bacterium JAD_PAG50586_3]